MHLRGCELSSKGCGQPSLRKQASAPTTAEAALDIVRGLVKEEKFAIACRLEGSTSAAVEDTMTGVTSEMDVVPQSLCFKTWFSYLFEINTSVLVILK